MGVAPLGCTRLVSELYAAMGGPRDYPMGGANPDFSQVRRSGLGGGESREKRGAVRCRPLPGTARVVDSLLEAVLDGE